MESPLLWRGKLSSWMRILRPHPSWNTQRSLNHQYPQSELIISLSDPPSKLTLLVPLFFPPLHPNPATTLPRRQRNPGERLGLAQSKQASGSTTTYRQMKACQNGGGSLDPFFTPRTSASAMSKSRGWPTGKLQPSGYQLHSRKRWLVVCSYLSECVGVKRLFPQRSLREFKIIKMCGVKKQWHWPWPSRGALFILE